MFASPHSLDLRLYCTPSTPVRSTLNCWPAFLPIVVQCGGKLLTAGLSPVEEENVVAALQHSDRVRSIELLLTDSFVEKLSTQVTEPFPELEDLVLQSTNGRLFLTSPPRWSPRLRVLHLTNVTLPSFPQLLSSSPNLVDLRLHNTSYSSPPIFPLAIVDTLSVMTRLEYLSIYCFSVHSALLHTGVPLSSGRRIVLPVLKQLDFRGFSKYFESLVAKIDAPCLRIIEIAFTYISDSHVDRQSQLGKFINRIDAQRSYTRADIQTSIDHTSIRFTLSVFGSPSNFLLRIYCKELDQQLSSMANICDHFPPFILGVRDLSIFTAPLSRAQDAVCDERWLRLLRPFDGARRLFVAGELATDILHALQQAEGEFAAVLPILRNFYVLKAYELPERLRAPLRAAVGAFTTSRQLSGRPVRVEYCSLADAIALLIPELEDDIGPSHCRPT